MMKFNESDKLKIAVSFWLDNIKYRQKFCCLVQNESFGEKPKLPYQKSGKTNMYRIKCKMLIL